MNLAERFWERVDKRSALARKHNMSQTQIWKIVTGKSWK